MKKTFWGHLAEEDWAGPVVEVLHAAYLLFWDAVKILALFGIAQGLEAVLEHLHIKPIVIYGHPIGATDIIQNFDYMLLFMFLCALVVRFFQILVTPK